MYPSHESIATPVYVQQHTCPSLEMTVQDCLDQSARKSAFQEQQALDAHGRGEETLTPKMNSFQLGFNEI